MATEQKTAVLAEAAGGIGKAISQRFAASGYQVVAGDADADGLKELTKALGNCRNLGTDE